MEEKTLRVRSKCKSPTFGLTLVEDPQYGRAYILDVNNKSSAAHLYSSKAIRKVICLSYIVEIVGHRVFSKSEASTALSK